MTNIEKQAAAQARADEMFREAGTTFEPRPDSTVAVTNWPKPRNGNGNMLQILMAEFEAEQAQKSLQP